MYTNLLIRIIIEKDKFDFNKLEVMFITDNDNTIHRTLLNIYIFAIMSFFI